VPAPTVAAIVVPVILAILLAIGFVVLKGNRETAVKSVDTL
jgi:hypothetical protein